jgi:hypothetical protein
MQSAMLWEMMTQTPNIDWSKSLLMLWAFLLVPWAAPAMGSSMAFEDGHTIGAYVFVWSVLTYPISVLIAAIFRRKVQWLVFLPCANIVAALLA